MQAPYFRRPICKVLSLFCPLLISEAISAPFVYDVPSTGTISNAATLTRTIDVTDDFTIDDLNVGFAATHVFRGDIEVTLIPPGGGGGVVVMASANDGDDNYSVLLDDEVSTALDDNNNDTVNGTTYQRSASPSNALSAFDGAGAMGLWTFEIADTFAADDGALVALSLRFDGTPTAGADSLELDCIEVTSSDAVAGTYELEVSVDFTNAAGTELTFEIGAQTFTRTIAAGAGGSASEVFTISGVTDTADSVQVYFTAAPAGAGDTATFTLGGEYTCVEYAYVHDPDINVTHKFAIDPVDGSLTEVGDPWMPAGIVNEPHGLAQDVNGNFYFSNLTTSPVDFDIDQISTFGAELQDGFIPNAFTGLTGQPPAFDSANPHFSPYNFFSRDGNLYAFSGEYDLVMAFDLSDGSLIGIQNVGTTVSNRTWGFYGDSTSWYLSVNNSGGTHSVYSGPIDQTAFDATGTQSGAKLFDLANTSGQPMGLTRDSDGNFYVVEQQTLGGTLASPKIVKYTSAGTFVSEITAAQSGNNSADGEAGWWGIRGLAYAETSGLLYAGSLENCVAVFDTDLNELPALNIGNPQNGRPKGIDTLTQCCPVKEFTTINAVICASDSSTQIFLQDLLGTFDAVAGFEGAVSEGVWAQTQTDLEFIYDSGNQTVQTTGAPGSVQFTLSSDGTGANNICGAFKITINVQSVPCDFGDLPDALLGTGAGDYETQEVNGGARHQIVSGLQMGALVDPDNGTLHNTTATADDGDGTADEDGVTVPAAIAAGGDATFVIAATNDVTGGEDANLCGFVDWNNDGDFDDTGESVSAVVPNSASGSNDYPLSFAVPAGAVIGTDLGARFRLTTDACAANGAAADGEVEDYVVQVGAPVGLGNVVFIDLNDDGNYDSAEGVDGVVLELWDPVNGVIGDLDDVQVDDPGQPGAQNYTVTTSGGGCYLFSGLVADNYYVKIPAGEFGAGQPLVGAESITGTQNGDDSAGEDGIDGDEAADGITSGIVSLTVDGEPTDGGSGALAENGKDNTSDNADDDNTDLTVDFGFTCPTITVTGTPDPLPDGSIGVAYPGGTVSASGGLAPYTYALESGSSLPAGLAMDSSGSITGSPTGPVGTVNFTVVGTDANGCAGEAAFTIGIGCTPLVITPSGALADAVFGQTYGTVTFAAAGGVGATTWTHSGTLPAGMSFDDANGELGGTPTEGGSFSFSVTGTDTTACAGTANLTLDVPVASIAGTTFEDTDGDDDADDPINATTIRLCSADGSTAIDNPNIAGTQDYVITTADGSYAFVNLTPGSYTVKQDQPVGFLTVTDGDTTAPGDDLPANSDTQDNSIPVTVAAGETDTGNDFVEVQPMAIGDFVFCDDDNDGLYEPLDGETGIDGVEVKLFHDVLDDGNFVEIATQTTDGGDYEFTGLYQGDYQVVVTAANFAKDGPLEFKSMSSTVTDTADNGENNDDNGTQTAPGGETTSPVITLSYGDEPGNTGATNEDHTVDFGFIEPVGVGNLVFIDTNGDGLYTDGTDTPVEQVTVEIYDAAAGPGVGAALDSTETDVDGCYQFTNLLPGDYIVHIPAAEFDAADDGDGFGTTGELLAQTSVAGASADYEEIDDASPSNDNGLDSPNPASTGISSLTISLAVGTEETGESGKGGGTDTPDENIDFTIDFAFRSATGVVGLGNLVFNDLNGDGDFDDATESGVDGVMVWLFTAASPPGSGMPIAQTMTHSGGCYYFGGLAPDSYVVHIPGSPFASGQPLEGLVSSAGFSGDDSADDHLNENGIDSPDPSAAGISSAVIALAAGGESPTQEIGKDSDSDDVAETDNDLTIDFGFTAANVGLGNLVFNDANGDGDFDSATESGVDDVTVELYSAGDMPGVDQPIATALTVGGGCYMFTGLAGGDYFVHVPSTEFAAGQPLDGLVSSPGNGGDDATDDGGDENGIDTSGATLSGVSTGVISLAAGTEVTPEIGKDGTSDNESENDYDLSIDLGFTAPSGVGIGNLVFCDTDGDGIYEPGDGDEGVPGLLVELYTSATPPGSGSALHSTITAPDGSYYFGDLADGTYIVHIPASEFGVGEALEDKVSSAGNGGDDGADDDAGENGIDSGNPALSGVSSSPIVLAAGGEPAESGAGGAGDNGQESDNDLTVDMAFSTAPGTVGIGNLVFSDDNNDGVFNDADDSGVDGVTVELYLASAGPGVGSPVATTETHSGGCYLFSGLAPESYIVHIPAAEFGSGGDLQNLDSIAGAGSDQTTDDGGDENGDDNTADGVSTGVFVLATTGMPADGDTETGKAAASDNATDGAVNLTADFGFAGKPDDYASFQNEFATELGSENEPDDNPDGDIYNNALEYALCDHPGSGDNANLFCVELGGTSGTVDAMFTRLAGGLSDVTYTLQVAPGLGSPPAWVTSTATPVVVDNGDGTETVTYPELEDQNAAGIARLQVEITGDTTGPHHTQTFGWHTQTNGAECETCSFPYAPKSVFSGTSTTAGPALTVVGTPVLDAGVEYYIEVLSGTFEGHRFDVASAAADTVNLAAASARNTLDPLPDLTGAPFALRPHTTLADIVPPALFAAQANPDDGDRLIAYVNGAWVTYWVFDMFGTQPKYWTSDGDDGLDDVGDSVIDACQGFFLHPKSGDVDVTSVGVVRDWDFACPLNAGYNLVGSGYPVDQTPDGRAMFKADTDGVQDWFTASNDPLQADQVLFWLGDTVAAAEGYDTYFRVDLGVPPYNHWTYQGDSNLADADSDLLFELGRAAFYDKIVGHDRSDLADVWLWPAPWTP